MYNHTSCICLTFPHSAFVFKCVCLFFEGVPISIWLDVGLNFVMGLSWVSQIDHITLSKNDSFCISSKGCNLRLINRVHIFTSKSSNYNVTVVVVSFLVISLLCFKQSSGCSTCGASPSADQRFLRWQSKTSIFWSLSPDNLSTFVSRHILLRHSSPAMVLGLGWSLRANQSFKTRSNWAGASHKISQKVIKWEAVYL